MKQNKWRTHHSKGARRIIVTKDLPGQRWLKILAEADCRIDICTSEEALHKQEILASIGNQCDGAIGQLTELWGEPLFKALKKAGGTAYSNYAVGFNNVDVAAATLHSIPVGNTPGVLTETTAEMAVALTFAVARRTGEAERFMRAGKFKGWLPDLFTGHLLWRKTVGIVGAGRIGEAYARMMVEGHKMNVIYYDLHANQPLEIFIADYSRFLESQGQPGVTCKRAQNIEDLLLQADCVSIHTILDDSTRHLFNADRLAKMKTDAMLINTSRGPVIDESALVDHCRANPDFRAGLDVFEDEPAMKPGLANLDNVVVVPHIASATRWTREGMAILAACNVVGILLGYPLWQQSDFLPFLENEPPKAIPSIVNAEILGKKKLEYRVQA